MISDEARRDLPLILWDTKTSVDPKTDDLMQEELKEIWDIEVWEQKEQHLDLMDTQKDEMIEEAKSESKIDDQSTSDTLVCPPNLPVMVDGVCVCTESSCGQGFWCNDGKCNVCSDDDPDHCGAACLKCGGSAPKCVMGKCGCLESEDCPKGKWCNENKICVNCIDDKHCGPDCVPCLPPTPKCAAGEKCVECFGNEDCKSGTWCDGQLCQPCTDDDPLHCGKDCLTCIPYHECVDGACKPCDTPEKCGWFCKPCPIEKKYCEPTTHECVECFSNQDCPTNSHCENYACKKDCEAQGCITDLKPDGLKCSTAKVIGRKDAYLGFSVTGDTTNADDNDNSSCWDAYNDNFYRIYLLAGESIDVAVTPKYYDFDTSLKIYMGTKCAKGGDKPLACADKQGNGKTEKIEGFIAGMDGWYSVVVDGEMAFPEENDYGPYVLNILLKCKQADCCCL